jgi:cytochrome c biogenesis protein CcdA
VAGFILFLTAGTAFLAGALSILSPCVLPLLPLLFLGARDAHPLGALFLTAGLALAFTASGLIVAILGVSLGLDDTLFQSISAGLLIAVGIVLVLPALQNRLAVLFRPVSTAIDDTAHRLSATRPLGQFGLGVVLGGAWAPCTGPTLGAAIVMAASGHDDFGATLTMLSFGVGAALPLLLLGRLSRVTLVRWRGRLLASGRHGRQTLGFVFVVFGVMIITGLSHTLETILLSHQPMWLMTLSTRY